MPLEYRLIDGYSGRYGVTACGSVISVHKMKSLKLRNRGSGYLAVTLRDSLRKTRTYNVHCLVAKYFIRRRPKGLCINHLDGVKTNNKVENLEYVTYSENSRHSFRMGLQCNKGERHSRSKLTDKNVTDIRNLSADGITQAGIAIIYHIHQSTVSKIVSRNRWSHV